jgi:hypothetical protein
MKKLDNQNNKQNKKDPYDIWKETEEDEKEEGKKKNLEEILGSKNNLWILKHESALIDMKKSKDSNAVNNKIKTPLKKK